MGGRQSPDSSCGSRGQCALAFDLSHALVGRLSRPGAPGNPSPCLTSQLLCWDLGEGGHHWKGRGDHSSLTTPLGGHLAEARALPASQAWSRAWPRLNIR